MSIFLTEHAENDFNQLTSEERQSVANVLIRSNHFNVKQLAGLRDLHRVRVGDLRLIVKRSGDEMTILRILHKPATRQYFADHRANNTTHQIQNRLPLSDSVIGKYIRGQTSAGMLASLEARIDARLSQLRDRADALGQEIVGVYESVQFLELAQVERGQQLERQFQGFREEFTVTLESLEDRVVRLESPRRLAFLRPSWASLISTWVTARFRSAT